MYDLERQLNAGTKEERLAALEALAQKTPIKGGEATNVNNHIHTTYSFSPYSPAMALWRARQSGLVTAGIMDHDSIAGAEEFLQAGRILGMGVTCGLECRVSFRESPFFERRINNPDQNGIVYMSLHGVPRRAFAEVQAFFAPYREARNRRNRAMVRGMNALLSGVDVALDFDRDVLPLSQWDDGGAVTERHLTMALARVLAARFGRGPALLAFVEGPMALPVGAKLRAQLADADNPYYDYDLLGLFKSQLVPRFYVDADEECPPVRDVLELAERTGSVSTYAYLGDVGDSVTGDKRAQAFEDGFLDELMGFLADLGFRAVTYMPTRNTPAQLARLRALCRQHGFFQVSGEDINSPRQSFLCEALRDPTFSNLIDATWALIAHERLSDADPQQGLFSAVSIARWPDIGQRVMAFADMGRSL